MTTRLPRSLPYSAYVSENVLVAEQQSVFARSWQYVGSINDFAGDTTALPIEVNGTPVILTLEGDAVGALVNVCSHRGSPVCLEPSTRESLTCPYHAWRYDLSGSLISAPRSEREPVFDAEEFGLERLPVGRWGPFIFVAASDKAIPFDELLGDLPDEVSDAGIEVEELVFHHRAEFQLAANWKIATENFLECYHCRVAHPGFSRTIETGPDDYLLATAATYSSQRGPAREEGGLLDTSGAVERSQFHLLFPNTAINIMPGEPNLSIGPIHPAGATRTTRFLDYFFGPEVSPDWIQQMIEFDDQVGREDVPLVENMQRGVTARPERSGVLFMDSERLIHHFETYLRSHVDYSGIT